MCVEELRTEAQASRRCSCHPRVFILICVCAETRAGLTVSTYVDMYSGMICTCLQTACTGFRVAHLTGGGRVVLRNAVSHRVV